MIGDKIMFAFLFIAGLLAVFTVLLNLGVLY